MNFRETQRKKQESKRDSIFRDGGKGVFKGKERDFVLSDSKLNLWGGIREDALDYFKRNKIQWWESGKSPSGHLLSSQIACINHLYFIRQREELATALLQNIDPGIEKALIVDNGFVEFEKTAKIPLGLEKSTSRGANCTSIDAIMLGKSIEGKKILFLIEWKYTESYGGEDLSKGKSGLVRVRTYERLINSTQCPIKKSFYEDLFFEPFYQMMRQTLLGWQMVSNREYNADDWMHVDVIPQKNLELRNKITSPYLSKLGKTIKDVWENILVDPKKYAMVDPEDFIRPVISFTDTKTIAEYLSKRYW